jgi:hypothetical protein
MSHKRKVREQGYALLEYCAGAAIIAAIIMVALDGLGGHLETLMDAIGTWAGNRAGELNG